MIRTMTGACLALALAGTIPASASANDDDAPIPKIETEGVWQPTGHGWQIPLWAADVELAKPDTGDHPEATGNGGNLVGGSMWHWASYVTRPTMTVYKAQGEINGAAMLVLPGGGFHAVATDLEGTEICDWVVQQGITCVMLKYRTPQVWERKDGVGQRPEILLPLEDAQRAMSLLRYDADMFGIDPDRIGVIGFSAGAYLAANMSNTGRRTYPLRDAADQQSPVPDFAILLYTARLWNNTPDDTRLDLAPWVEISPAAPPTLLIQAMDDPVDNVRHPMAYALALTKAGVPVDLRLYASGGHAFGLRPAEAPITTQWPGQVLQWLQNIGVIGR